MNLTPMIDIVFLLIIFFITVSQITPIINYPVDLPVAQVNGDTPQLVKLTINIEQNGRYFVAGTQLTRDQLQQWLAEQAKRVGTQIQDLQVLIRCDRLAESRFVNQLIPRMTELGIVQVKISVRGEQ